MLFGITEIQEYEKTCTDPYVLAIIKKLWESRKTCAKQQEYIFKLESDLEYYESTVSGIRNMLQT